MKQLESQLSIRYTMRQTVLGIYSLLIVPQIALLIFHLPCWKQEEPLRWMENGVSCRHFCLTVIGLYRYILLVMAKIVRIRVWQTVLTGLIYAVLLWGPRVGHNPSLVVLIGILYPHGVLLCEHQMCHKQEEELTDSTMGCEV